MIYSSLEFFVLMMTAALLVRLGGPSFKKGVLIISSLIFFIWAGAFNFFLMMAIIIFLWSMIYLQTKIPRLKKTVTILVTFTLLLHLFMWKYLGWTLIQFGIHPTSTIILWILHEGLPIGISFYTLQGIAYIIDLYRGEAEPLNFLDFLLFKTFFGQLIAGPIVRYHELVPQIQIPEGGNNDDFMNGLELFVLGFLKKVVIADRIATMVDPVFHAIPSHNGVQIFYGVLAYSIQIWADFSGYTDMGRGAACMAGIHLPINFRSPYLSSSPSEFWRRWHITLGIWMRDFLYNPFMIAFDFRDKIFGAAFCIFLTMLIGGLWHGAAWTFVLWGAYQGLSIGLQSYARTKLDFSVPKWLSYILFMSFVLFGWLIFRIESTHDLFVAVHSLTHIHMSQLYLDKVIPAFFIFMMAIQIIEDRYETFKNFHLNLSPVLRGTLCAVVFLLAMICQGTASPFIYFQF